MTSKNLKELFEELRGRRLDDAERDSMRQNLLTFMKQRPVVRDSEIARHTWIERRLISMPALIIALLIALSGGVSAAANTAVPGDALYGIKTEINEPIRVAFAVGVEAKARAEATFAEARVEEAEKLAAKGELGADVAAKLSDRFEARAERVNVFIDKLEAEGKTEAAARVSASLEASLAAHNRILQRLETKSAANIQEKVKVRTEKATEIRARTEHKVRAEAEGRADIQTAAEGKMRASSKKIAEVKKFIEKVETRLGADATAEAKARLAVAQSAFAEGQAKMEAKAYGEAFAFFQKSMRIAQEAKVLVDMGARLRL